MSNQNEPKNPQAAQQSPPDPLPASRARRWEKPTFTVAFSHPCVSTSSRDPELLDVLPPIARNPTRRTRRFRSRTAVLPVNETDVKLA